MKRVLGALLILAIFLVPLPAKADDTPRVFLDGQELTFDVSPVIVEGRVLVPISQIFKYFDISFRWDSATMTASFDQDYYLLSSVTIDSTNAVVRNQIVELDVPPMIINGRTMVPLRFVAQAANCSINYNPENNIVEIKSVGSPINSQTDNTWIYYINQSSEIVKQKPDGSMKISLPSDGNLERWGLRLNGDYLYYYEDTKAEYHTQLPLMKRINTQTMQNPATFSDFDIYKFVIEDNKAYYIDSKNKDKLTRKSLGSAESTVEISEDWCSDFKIVDNWIYYCYGSGSKFYLYKSDKNGGSKTLLVESPVPITSLYVVNNSLFYQLQDRMGDNYVITRYGLDGTGTKRIVYETRLIESWIVLDNNIFYTVYESNLQACQGIYKTDFNGQNTTTISNDYCMNIKGKNGWVYYLNGSANNSLYGLKTDGSGKTKITNVKGTDVCVN
ncbi:MAG: DUF5050 domain-containing protein [Syntrophomonadaceae bacterium]